MFWRLFRTDHISKTGSSFCIQKWMRDIFELAHLNSQRSQTLQESISGQRHILDEFRVGSDIVLHRDKRRVRHDRSLIKEPINLKFCLSRSKLVNTVGVFSFTIVTFNEGKINKASAQGVVNSQWHLTNTLTHSDNRLVFPHFPQKHAFTLTDLTVPILMWTHTHTIIMWLEMFLLNLKKGQCSLCDQSCDLTVSPNHFTKCVL